MFAHLQTLEGDAGELHARDLENVTAQDLADDIQGARSHLGDLDLYPGVLPGRRQRHRGGWLHVQAFKMPATQDTRDLDITHHALKLQVIGHGKAVLCARKALGQFAVGRQKQHTLAREVERSDHLPWQFGIRQVTTNAWSALLRRLALRRDLRSGYRGQTGAWLEQDAVVGRIARHAHATERHANPFGIHLDAWIRHDGAIDGDLTLGDEALGLPT